MLELYSENQVIMNVILLSILLAIVIGIWWGKKSVRAPFVERRLEKRTLWKRIKWRLSHRPRARYS